MQQRTVTIGRRRVRVVVARGVLLRRGWGRVVIAARWWRGSVRLRTWWWRRSIRLTRSVGLRTWLWGRSVRLTRSVRLRARLGRRGRVRLAMWWRRSIRLARLWRRSVRLRTRLRRRSVWLTGSVRLRARLRRRRIRLTWLNRLNRLNRLGRIGRITARIGRSRVILNVRGLRGVVRRNRVVLRKGLGLMQPPQLYSRGLVRLSRVEVRRIGRIHEGGRSELTGRDVAHKLRNHLGNYRVSHEPKRNRGRCESHSRPPSASRRNTKTSEHHRCGTPASRSAWYCCPSCSEEQPRRKGCYTRKGAG